MWNLGLLGAAVGSAAQIASSYDLLETALVEGTASEVEFTNLTQYAGTYDNFQILFSTRSARSNNSADALVMRLGVSGTTDGADNYSSHYMRVGSGTSNFGASASATSSWMNLNNNATAGLYPSGGFSVGVIDLLEPFNTDKYPTLMAMGGQTYPEASLYLSSGNYRNSAQISNIWFRHEVSNCDVGSRFSLYGWRNS
jgi:hypothetical protein